MAVSPAPTSPPPLPPRGEVPGVDVVLVTADYATLPPAIAGLVDPAAPVPSDVTFFEKRVTGGDVLWAVVGVIVCVGLAVVCIPAGVYYLFHPIGPVTVSSGSDTFLLGVGAISALIAWIMATSVIDRIRIWGDQRAGRPTRVGIFLTPAAIVEAADSTVTVLPRSQISRVDGRTVHYRRNGADKSLQLPMTLVHAPAEQMHAAVARWAN